MTPFTITLTARAAVAGVVSLALLLALVAAFAAGRAAADPQRPISSDDAWRLSCGHLGVSCPGPAHAQRRHTTRHAHDARRTQARHHGGR
jgi:hypothetical protein